MTVATRGMRRDAYVTVDGLYRYTLTRRWEPGPGEQATRPVLWIGLNPSTADGLTDDATVRRIVGFTRGFGYSAFTLVNLFALRSRDPGVLAAAPDPVGPTNNATIGIESSRAGLVVAAWGAHPFARERAAQVVERLRGRDVALWCLALTKDGAPRHPLYAPGSSTLRELP